MKMSEMVNKLNELIEMMGDCEISVGGEIGYGEYVGGDDLEVFGDGDEGVCVINVSNLDWVE